jgi:hypothetical protein
MSAAGAAAAAAGVGHGVIPVQPLQAAQETHAHAQWLQRVSASDSLSRVAFDAKGKGVLVALSKTAVWHLRMVLHFIGMVQLLYDSRAGKETFQDAAEVCRVHLNSVSNNNAGERAYNAWNKVRRPFSSPVFVAWWEQHTEDTSQVTRNHLTSIHRVHKLLLEYLKGQTPVDSSQSMEQRVVAFWQQAWKPNVADMELVFIQQSQCMRSLCRAACRAPRAQLTPAS